MEFDHFQVKTSALVVAVAGVLASRRRAGLLASTVLSSLPASRVCRGGPGDVVLINS